MDQRAASQLMVGLLMSLTSSFRKGKKESALLMYIGAYFLTYRLRPNVLHPEEKKHLGYAHLFLPSRPPCMFRPQDPPTSVPHHAHTRGKITHAVSL
jgi:hypothetical protein